MHKTQCNDGKAKSFKKLYKTKVNKSLGLAPDLKNKSGRSASRDLPKATPTFWLKLTIGHLDGECVNQFIQDLHRVMLGWLGRLGWLC